MKITDQNIEGYFAACKSSRDIPTLTGLALWLGLDNRQQLEDKAKTDRRLRRAISRVEDATIQAAYGKDTGKMAVWFLEELFGYGGDGLAFEDKVISVAVDDYSAQG